MSSSCTPSFWSHYRKLPKKLRKEADQAYDAWVIDSTAKGLDFKPRKGCKTIPLWSARVTKGYRAVCTKHKQDYIWFWIGTHAEYDKLKC